MSRRPTADRAAQNQQTIKNLLKLEPNKICADCKRNKHPRWASWNLGVFVCIRCSGIHRGMGTHISRVKSVDLDAWTDEQLQSVLRWGNARANKYWEAKLTTGHVPSEAKIENFIRTKYESKRWAMDGPIPDPATLGNDDDVPLAVVQEKAKLERSASHRVSSMSSQPTVRRHPRPSVDLFGDDELVNPPARPSTTEPPAVARPPPPIAAQDAAKQSKPADSLLGLDFFGSSQSTPASRPGSTVPAPGSQAGMSRPDLKQSILSLYATAPKPQSAPAQHERTSSFGNMSSAQSQSSNLGGLTDAFSGLSFPSTTTSAPPRPPKPQNTDVFASLSGFSSPRSPPAAPRVTSTGISASGGGLFDSIASNNPAPKPTVVRTSSVSSNGLDFSFAQKKPSSPLSQPKPPAPSFSNDLFDLTAPSATKSTSPPLPKPVPPQAAPNLNSVFNLSTNNSHQPAPKAAPTTSTSSNFTSMFSSASIDPWGGNAWSNPDPTPTPPAAPAPSSSNTMKMPDTLTSSDIGAGWGASPNASKPAPAPATALAATAAPTVAADEDFGGWASAAPTTTITGNKPSNGGFGGNDDLFSNVWK